MTTSEEEWRVHESVKEYKHVKHSPDLSYKGCEGEPEKLLLVLIIKPFDFRHVSVNSINLCASLDRNSRSLLLSNKIPANREWKLSTHTRGMGAVSVSQAAASRENAVRERISTVRGWTRMGLRKGGSCCRERCPGQRRGLKGEVVHRCVR